MLTRSRRALSLCFAALTLLLGPTQVEAGVDQYGRTTVVQTCDNPDGGWPQTCGNTANPMPVAVVSSVPLAAAVGDGGPFTVIPFFPACADFPCVSPDAGTDWACPEAPGATVQIVSFVANVNYRSKPGPDAGLFAYASDNAVGAPAGYRYTLTSADCGLADGGCFVSVHLSAVDASASVSHCP